MTEKFQSQVMYLGATWEEVQANLDSSAFPPLPEQSKAGERILPGDTIPAPPQEFKPVPMTPEVHKLYEKAQLCKFLTKSNCGCAHWGTCSLGKGDATNRVKIQDCIDCVRDGGNGPPSLLQKISSVTTAAKDFVQSGGKLVSEAKKQERLAICQGCEHFADGKCTVCTCIMSIKTAMAVMSCPLTPPKWGAETEGESKHSS